MIIVTGTKRSGTSMWMQIMMAGGFPSIGEAFSGVWSESIRDANPRGFYESRFRQGVYYATNPDPSSGTFLHPRKVHKHVVKIFVPGLLRTDYSYISAVIATARDWREYSASLQRLYDMEDLYRVKNPASAASLLDKPFPDEEIETRMRAGRIPPALEWWFENYDLIRDFAVRQYPFHMTTYDRLLRDPLKEVTKVFEWLGEGDSHAASQAVEPLLRTQQRSTIVDDSVSGFEEIFDELYGVLDQGKALNSAFIEMLNETNKRLMTRWHDIVTERKEAVKIGIR